MSFARDLHRVAFALAFGASIVACASVLGFPDRTLDDGVDANSSETSTADGGTGTDDGGTPTGPATAAFSRSAIDFGLVACGAAAPADQTVTITNTGGEPLTWTATLSSTPQFAINGPAGGTLGPGASGTVAISATPVPGTAGAGDTQQAVLTITTNDAAKASTDLPVKLTAGGGTLTLVPLTASFGDSPFSVGMDAGIAATDVPIALKNTGNQPLTVNLTQPTDTQFTARWTGYPAAVVLQPGAVFPDLVGKFTPAQLGDSVGSAPIVVSSGALCGTSPTAITMTGAGTGSNFSVQPGSLDFGTVDCGTTAGAKTITVKNTSSTTAFNITDVSLAGAASSPYVVTIGGNAIATPVSVAAGASVVITVTPKAIPSVSEVTPNLYGDTLTVTTDDPSDSPHALDLRMTAQGAILSQSSASIDFGAVILNTTATTPITVTNSGNVPATVSYGLGTAAFGLTPQGQTVAGGSKYTADVTFTPTAKTAYASTATMSIAPGPVLCAPLPAGITLAGQGAVSASLSPTSLDFGLVSCNTTAAAKTVVLKNTGTAAFTWNGTLGKTYYAIAPKTGSLNPGDTVTITVTPAKVPATSATTADLYADTLTIATTPSLESPYLVSLHETASGAILSFNPTSLAFGYVRAGRSSTLSFAVANSGNVAAPYTLSIGGSNPAVFSVTPTSGTAGAGSSAAESAKFSPAVSGGRSANVSLATSAVRCGPIPNPLTMSGTGY
jgi:hypothetical protein